MEDTAGFCNKKQNYPGKWRLLQTKKPFSLSGERLSPTPVVKSGMCADEFADLRAHHLAPAPARENAVMAGLRHGEVLLLRLRNAAAQVVCGLRLARSRNVVEFAFGDVYTRPGLSLRDRELAAVAMLAAKGGCEPQLDVHLHAARNVGLTVEELREVLIQVAPYAGFPAAINAMRRLQALEAEEAAG